MIINILVTAEETPQTVLDKISGESKTFAIYGPTMDSLSGWNLWELNSYIELIQGLPPRISDLDLDPFFMDLVIEDRVKILTALNKTNVTTLRLEGTSLARKDSDELKAMWAGLAHPPVNTFSIRSYKKEQAHVLKTIPEQIINLEITPAIDNLSEHVKRQYMAEICYAAPPSVQKVTFMGIELEDNNLELARLKGELYHFIESDNKISSDKKIIAKLQELKDIFLNEDLNSFPKKQVRDWKLGFQRMCVDANEYECLNRANGILHEMEELTSSSNDLNADFNLQAPSPLALTPSPEQVNRVINALDETEELTFRYDTAFNPNPSPPLALTISPEQVKEVDQPFFKALKDLETFNSNNQNSSLATKVTELIVEVRKLSTKKPELQPELVIILNDTMKLLKTNLSPEDYQNKANQVKGSPSKGLQIIGSIMAAIGLLVATIGIGLLASGVAAIPGAIMIGAGGGAAALGGTFFIFNRKSSGLSKKMNDLAEETQKTLNMYK